MIMKSMLSNSKNMFLKSIIAFLLIFFFGVVFNQHANAQSEFSYTNHRVDVVLNDDDSADFDISLDLSNNSDINIVTGYTYIFPNFEGVSPNATLEGRQASINVSQIDDDFLKLGVVFSEPLKPAESARLNITANISNFVKKINDTRIIQFRIPEDEIDQFKINYMKDLGSPSFIALDNSQIKDNDDTYELMLENTNSVFIIWGDEYSVGVKSEFKIKNPNNNSTDLLTSVIPDFLNQDVEYKEILNGDFGVTDDFGNKFIVSNVSGDSEVTIQFEANVTKSLGDLRLDNHKELNIARGRSNDLLKISREKTSENALNTSKIKLLHDYLLSNYPLNLDESLSFESVDQYWSRLNSKQNFESFDYCFVLTGIAEELGLKAQIRYGYIMLPSNFGKNPFPHFWCIFEDGENTFLVDPYMEQLTGYSYFGIDNDVDRINVGIWHPEQDYNNVLGLLREDRLAQKIETGGKYLLSDSEDEISLDVSPQDKKIYSGFFHSLRANVINNTSSFIDLDQIYYDDELVDSANEFNDQLKYSLIPNHTNNIQVNSLRNPNFFDDSEREVSLEFFFEDGEKAQDKVLINYSASNVAIIIGVIVFNIFTISSAYVFWKSYLSKRFL